MKVEERERIAKVLERWVPFFIYTCVFIGVTLASFIVYYIDGDFPMEVWTSGAVVFAGFTIYEIIKQGRKKSDLPEADERTIWNMSRFFAFLSHTYIAILFVRSEVHTSELQSRGHLVSRLLLA